VIGQHILGVYLSPQLPFVSLESFRLERINTEYQMKVCINVTFLMDDVDDTKKDKKTVGVMFLWFLVLNCTALSTIDPKREM
jgi:hypothetical protein